MKKLALLFIPSAFILVGCSGSGQAEVTKDQEDHFRNPSKTPPAGMTAGPPPQAMGAPEGATNGPSK